MDYHESSLLLSAVCFICLVAVCLQVWSLKVEQEEEKNKALTEALQTLATEHQELQCSWTKSRKSSTLSTLTEDDFFDAVSGQQSLAGQLIVISYHKKSLHTDEHTLPVQNQFHHLDLTKPLIG